MKWESPPKMPLIQVLLEQSAGEVPHTHKRKAINSGVGIIVICPERRVSLEV